MLRKKKSPFRATLSQGYEKKNIYIYDNNDNHNNNSNKSRSPGK